jgi:hypothetical protein
MQRDEQAPVLEEPPGAAPQFFLAGRPQRGMTYPEYMAFLRSEAERAQKHPEWVAEDPHAQYLKLNRHRAERVEKSYQVPPELRQAVERIAEPQLWMVLTEAWCGDSAQTLGCVAAMAAANPLIDLRFLPRDDNLDIMQRYLTQGTASIPKLVALDGAGHELFQWGPRPAPAAELFRRSRAAGASKEASLEKLHAWYARDRGESVGAEILKLLRGVAAPEIVAPSR